ncbi:MerR family transcriptional regulator [Daejeonella lutea]|uniref:MerR HTH family regulatory protein n=1 Tax=Daejeonella lutea TaxID=572036 RepID=A0A1T5AG98_9SPHI|nr:MerR family transcriptional regulator [Daejeonella lutea]SKB34042.1 MerR HTH family regulatory protein [Daejeonella lutea]
MNVFSISQLSQYSGIKPHTIRIWEQRYKALQPDRSEKNTRYYDGEQLRRLLNIVSLMETKHKVSELCAMPDEKLSTLVLQSNDLSIHDNHEYFVSQLISAGMCYDESRFEALFEDALAKYGLESMYQMIIYPMLVRVGVMWSANVIPSVQEHFISNLVRQKILKAIDALPPAALNSNTWLLFLPEDEYHEIGLLFAAFIIRKSGHKVVYLGSSVSYEAALSAMRDINPKYLLLFLVRYNLFENINQYVNDLNNAFNGEKIYLAGNQKLLSQLDLRQKSVWLRDISSLHNEIKQLNTV